VNSQGLISPPAQGETSTGGLIDLNLASPTLLATLPGIGPVLARAIVDHRDDNGPFRSEVVSDGANIWVKTGGG